MVVSLLGAAGCVSSPEHCHSCLAALADAGEPDVLGLDAGTGGTPGTGGRGPIGTGGAAGASNGTGGLGTGGVATGGAATGGRGVGGTGTGGAATGGAATGGRGIGGTTGGAATGGAATGGAATGGASTGGASTGGAGTGGAGTGGATDLGLVLHYTFDEAGGTTAADTSGFTGVPLNGVLTPAGAGTPTFSATAPLQIGSHYLNLPGTSANDGGYVVAPSLGTLQSALAPDAITLAAWVFVANDVAWQRIFDFGIIPTGGGNPSIYMYLTTHQIAVTPNSVRFTITAAGNGAAQQVIPSAAGLLPTNSWHHVAVVLPTGATYTGSIYVDGALQGTNTAMTLHPSSLTGAGTPYGYIGKSAFPDPYFAGRIDDFRIYNRALSAAEIAQLFALR